MTSPNVLARKLHYAPNSGDALDKLETIAERLRAALIARVNALWSAQIEIDVRAHGREPIQPSHPVLEKAGLTADIVVGGSADAARIFVDTEIAHQIVSLELGGGPAVDSALAERAPSSLDARICRRTLTALVEAFDETLRTEAPDKALPGAALGAVAALSRKSRSGGSDSAAVCFTTALAFDGAESRGGLHLVVPLANIDAALKTSSSVDATAASTVDDWSRALRGAIFKAPLELRAILHREVAPVADLTRLNVGDVIPLETASLERVSLCTSCMDGEVVVARGRLGRSKGAKAIQLDESPRDEFLAPLAEELATEDI